MVKELLGGQRQKLLIVLDLIPKPKVVFLDEAESLCDWVCVLKKGKAVFYGTVEEAVADSPYDKFEDAYLWYSDEEVNDDENI